MSALAMPFRRLILAVVLMAAPTAAAVLVLWLAGMVSLLAGVVILVTATGGAGLILVYYIESDIRAVSAYIDRLGSVDAVEEPLPPATPDTPLPESGWARTVLAAVIRLHRSWRRRFLRQKRSVDANASMLQALLDPVILLDGDRRVKRANAAAQALFGPSMIGRDLATGLRHPRVLEAVGVVLKGGEPTVIEWTVQGPVERMFEVRIIPVAFTGPDGPEGADADALLGDEDFGAEPQQGDSAPGEAGEGNVDAVMISLHDITKIKRSEQMRADFVANASHELRTPLSSLLGFIETLRGPAADDRDAQVRFLGIMQDQARRMSRLVEDLMSLSRIELDEHTLPRDEVAIPTVLNRVIAGLELKAADRRMRVRITVTGENPPVRGDADQLAQVFQNLIDNALKYGREETDVVVTVAPQGEGRQVLVSVRDHGAGIARQHLPRLTERFYRVDAARSKAMGGTGLGLAIVKHIVNRHRGRLMIDSKPGEGSTFSVLLPTVPAGERQAFDPYDKHGSGSESAA